MDPLSVMNESLQTMRQSLAGFLPRMAGALLFLILGWAAAKLSRTVAIRFLRLVRLDAAAERAGIEDFLLQGGVRFTAVTLFGQLVYWLILFAAVLAGLNSLGVGGAAGLFDRIVLYIPQVLIAVIVLIFGLLFAKTLRGAVFTYLSNVGVEGAPAIAAASEYAVLFFVASLVLEQLAIGGQVLVAAFKMAFGALCLAFGLAFGLGGRKWAAQILDKIWKV